MPMAFVPLDPHRFHVGFAEEIRLVHLHDVSVFEAVGSDCVAQLGVENGVRPQTAVLRQ